MPEQKNTKTYPQPTPPPLTPENITRRTALAIAATATVGGCHLLETKRCRLAIYSLTGRWYTGRLELPESLFILIVGSAISLQPDQCRLDLVNNKQLSIRGITAYGREEIASHFTTPSCPPSFETPTLILTLDRNFECTAEWANNFPAGAHDDIAAKFELSDALIPYVWRGPERYEAASFGLRQRPVPFESKVGSSEVGTPHGERNHHDCSFLLSPEVSPQIVLNSAFDLTLNETEYFRTQTNLAHLWQNRPNDHNAFWFEPTADGKIRVATFHTPTRTIRELFHMSEIGDLDRPSDFTTFVTEIADTYASPSYKRSSPRPTMDLRFNDEK